MRSEHDITLEWRRIFKDGILSEETLDRAQQLLDELSAESPLRFRFENELNELRKIANKRETECQ